ncbi:MAG: daunorubicin ABC transporter ATP-binding protein [Acidiferrobacteraceae bacterium]|nr:daunorubicin ABC transporter ATP-binding protein [Acidiferrobacteraceae bacterium]
MLAVKAQNLSKTYKTKQESIEAVKDVSFNVKQGEIFGILGPNGAGKSSVILMLTTLLKPTGGVAEILGLSVIGNESLVREKIGVALQETGIDENLTGKELLHSTSRLWGLDKQHSEKRSNDLLRLVGLLKDSNRRVKTYSGGMKRRLDLALSLVHEPKVLFLDEPTTGLDPGSRRVLWDEITRLKNSGVAIILTTQYLDEADELADRIAIIHEGRVVKEGTPNELKASIGGDVVTFTFSNKDLAKKAIELTPNAEMFENELRVTVPNGPQFIPEAFVRLRNAQIDVAAVSASKPTLDDVFLSVTGSTLSEVDDKT